MAEDRPIPPSASRLARAHAAGIRADPRWLSTGIVCLVLAGALASIDPQALAASLQIGGPQIAGHYDDVAVLALTRGLTLWGTLLAAVLGALLLIRLATGSLGAIDSRAAEGLDAAPVAASGAAMAGAAIVGLGVLVAVVIGVLAAAARGVDASEAGQLQLWSGWAVRLLLAAGATLCPIGLLELSSWRSSRWRALHQSVEQARRAAADRSRKAAR